MRHALSRSLLPIAALGALLLGGCVYRVGILQGNILEAKDVDQVQLGMTRSQVRYLLGTPMVADTFDTDRWDYIYYVKDGKSGDSLTVHLLIGFENDAVTRIERVKGLKPTQPAADSAAVTPAPTAPTSADPVATPAAEQPAPSPPAG